MQPEDWDDEEDGEWTAPTIPNPEYKGPWKPKVCGVFTLSWMTYPRVCCLMLNLSYFQRIKNPNYKGKWKAPMIDNPGPFSCQYYFYILF